MESPADLLQVNFPWRADQEKSELAVWTAMRAWSCGQGGAGGMQEGAGSLFTAASMAEPAEGTVQVGSSAVSPRSG